MIETEIVETEQNPANADSISAETQFTVQRH